jgi:hypothetical protein
LPPILAAAYWGQQLLMDTRSNKTPANTKPNWPLILGAIAAGVLVLSLVGGLVAMYVANFNLLGWLE